MICISATQATVLTSPPYNWHAKSVSFVNSGQIIVALIAVPLLGYGSDYLIKLRARRNNGIHEPENRLILLIIPLAVGIVALLLYGFTAQYPSRIGWGALIFAVPADFFSFMGCNITTITYLLDSYPTQAAPLLILITAIRGFVGFGVSYDIVGFVNKAGYDGAFGTFAGLNFIFAILGIALFFYGKRLRQATARFV